MGIFKQNLPIIGVFKLNIPIIKIYKEKYLVWELYVPEDPTEIPSCFSNGYWIDEYPWTDNTPWIN